MAVTLLESDFKQPEGELDAALFPLGDIDMLLSGWLAQAIVKVEGADGIDADSHNDAAAAWVYFRAYRHVSMRLAAEPGDVRVEGELAIKTAADQRAYFARLAAEKLAEYVGYDVEGVTSPAMSSHAVNVAVW